MKGIGETFKSARRGRRLSVDKLENKTKIKKEFIRAIEGENWNGLPTFPVVLGFVKNIAKSVGVDEKKAEALLKRDYPPKRLAINPKPDVTKRFQWGPKHTFFMSVGLVLIIVFSYLGLQYSKFVSPPDLEINSPQEGAKINGNSVLVEGITDLDVTIFANNQPVIVDENGRFSFQLGVNSNTTIVEVVARSRSGKETKVIRVISVEN